MRDYASNNLKKENASKLKLKKQANDNNDNKVAETDSFNSFDSHEMDIDSDIQECMNGILDDINDKKEDEEIEDNDIIMEKRRYLQNHKILCLYQLRKEQGKLVFEKLLVQPVMLS